MVTESIDFFTSKNDEPDCYLCLGSKEVYDGVQVLVCPNCTTKDLDENQIRYVEKLSKTMKSVSENLFDEPED